MLIKIAKIVLEMIMISQKSITIISSFEISKKAGKMEKNIKNQIDYPSHHKIFPLVYQIFF